MPEVTSAMVVNQMRRMMDGSWTYNFGAEVGNYPNSTASKKIDCSEATEAAVRWAAESVNSPVRLTDGSFAQHDACYNKGLLIPLEQGRRTPGALVFLSRKANVTPGMGRDGIYHVGLVGEDDKVHEACCANGDRIKTINFGARNWYSKAGLIPGVVYPAAPTTPPPVQPPVKEETFRLAYEGGKFMTLRYLKNKPVNMRGGDVKSLQGLLNQKGFNAGSEDGSFGNKTEAAVKRAQKALGLTQDGVVGAATHEKLWER